MKETTKMSRAVAQLEKMYNTLNADKFESALPTPIITVQSKPGTWGHCSRAQIWKRKDETTYELNIAAEAVSGPIEEIVDTLIHEMVHMYCRENGIQEVSRGGHYHNGKFKELAEEKGLLCIKQGNAGWDTTAQGNDKLIEYILEKGWNEIKIGRENTATMGLGLIAVGGLSIGPGQKPPKAPSSTRKLQCPCCGNSVRATKTVNIICGDCMEKMVEV